MKLKTSKRVIAIFLSLLLTVSVAVIRLLRFIVRQKLCTGTLVQAPARTHRAPTARDEADNKNHPGTKTSTGPARNEDPPQETQQQQGNPRPTARRIYAYTHHEGYSGAVSKTWSVKASAAVRSGGSPSPGGLLRRRPSARYLVGGPGWSGAGPAAAGMMSCPCT